MKDFWLTLFNPGEQICMSDTIYGTALSDHGPLKQFFSINPLHTSRADVNTTALRNILVEFDSGSISEQLEYLKTSGLPYTTLVYSGGKSLHAIISVLEGFGSLEEYKRIAMAVLKKAGSDPACKNPSRFSRTPRAFRDNGQEQELLEVRERVPLEALLAWAGPIEPAKPISEQPIRTDKALSTFVWAFLTYGAEEGTRNRTLFRNACEMFRAGYSEGEIIELVEASPLDLTSDEIRQCVRSAARAVNQ